MSSPARDVIKVNVGGVLYTTTKSTLSRYPDSMLGAMFNGNFPSNLDDAGNYFIDRDGHLFRYILNFLRCSELCLPKNFNEMELLLTEADFYQIQPLIETIKDQWKSKLSKSNDIVQINVGGVLYTTTNSTLTRYPDSMLGAMFKGNFPTNHDENGNYFIDRDGHLFRYILNFLRCSKLNLPRDFSEMSLLQAEADFYQIEPLIEALEELKTSWDDSPGVYIEIKDHIHRFKGWHINTSITGPFDTLLKVPPFMQELNHGNAYRPAWTDDNDIAELFLENGTRSRLGWAMCLKRCGWIFLTSTSSAHSKCPNDGADSQQLIIIDKWYMPCSVLEAQRKANPPPVTHDS